MNPLKRLTCRPEVIKVARWLGLRRLLRKGYYWWARPRHGILRLRIAGISSQFRVHTSEELRLLESEGGAGGEERILDLLVSFLGPGDVVYDVGSNVGLYAVLLAKRVGAQGLVVAFEPQEQNYIHLQENLKLNGLENVRSYRKALGDRGGRAKLYASEVIGSSSLVQQQPRDAVAAVVDVSTGDDLVALEHLPVPRVVKIDVEGYEYAVICGLRETLSQPGCELVSCEVHPSLLPAGVTPGAASSLLKQLGFVRFDSYARWDGTFHLAAYKGSPTPV
jgi:FkbM family methyltransferase